MYKFITVVLGLILSGFSAVALPGDLKMEVFSNGKSSGAIAEIHVVNQGAEHYLDFAGPFVVFSNDKYAPIWIDRFFIDLEPGKNITIQAKGTTLLFTLPVPPKGHKLQKSIKWYPEGNPEYIFPDENMGEKSGVSPSDMDKPPKISLSYPGTDLLFPYRIDPFVNPEYFSKYMLEAEIWIRTAYKRLKSADKIKTVLAGNPKLEEDFITQVLTWTVAGILTGDHFKQKELYEQVLTKYLQATGSRERKLSQKVVKSLKQGSEDIWRAVLYTGMEAGLIVQNEMQNAQLPRFSLQRNGVCTIGLGKRNLYVEDPSVCEMLGGRFQELSASDFTKFSRPKSDITVSEMDNLIGVGNELEMKGKLEGSLNEVSDLYVSISNDVISNYKVNLNKTSGKFSFNIPALAPGKNEIFLDVKKKSGDKIPLLKSRVTMEYDTIRLARGGSITIDKRTVFLRSIRSGSILLNDGTTSYPVMRGRGFALTGAEISLHGLSQSRGYATLIIKRKTCIRSFGDGYQAHPEKEELNIAIPEHTPETFGYKGVLLPPQSGVRIPDKNVLAVMSAFKVTPHTMLCGWQMTEHLDDAWGSALSRLLMGTLMDLKKKNQMKLKDFKVIYIDTLSRQLVSTMKSNNFAEQKHWIYRKLVNPDYILDGEVRFSCCNPERAGSCTGTSLKAELYVRLIEAQTGRIITTYSRGLGRRNVENDLICLDSFGQDAKGYRDLILEDFTKNAVDYFRDYMTGKW